MSGRTLCAGERLQVRQRTLERQPLQGRHVRETVPILPESELLRRRGSREYALRGQRVLVAAENIAIVSASAVAVVARLSRIKDTVAAPVAVAVRSARGIGRKRVAGTLITFFSVIKDAVAARIRSRQTALAPVRERRIVRRLFALLSEEFLHQTVSADADFQEAG